MPVAGMRPAAQRVLLWASALIGLALAAASGARAALPTLYFHYAADCTFQLVNDSGGAVATIPPGDYQVVIDTPYPFATTPAACLNVEFDLTGPGVDITTTLGDGGSDIEQYPVTLKPSSTYVAQDDAAAAKTRKTFTTSASGTPAPVTITGTTPSTTSSGGATTASGSGKTSAIGEPLVGAGLRGTLVGTVAASGKLTLTRNGKQVQILPAGRYQFSIVDHSRSNGFTVQASHSPPIVLTAGAFTGKRSKAITLNRGQWLFYGSFVGKKTYFIVTAS